MKATDKWDQDQNVYVDYYLLNKSEIGRVTYDSVTGEYLGGEVMGKSGHWCKYAINMILRDSELLTPEEAEEYIRGLCGQIRK
ncbi:MAG: hypothetical protein ISS69_13950 [Phycisphaerae bacterium]|nr:hypothetical protein [Phycisphaerae bacterium]